MGQQYCPQLAGTTLLLVDVLEVACFHSVFYLSNDSLHLSCHCPAFYPQGQPCIGNVVPFSANIFYWVVDVGGWLVDAIFSFCIQAVTFSLSLCMWD